ncbi:hypothetical protein [Nonomuraea recticatena]|uniref:GATA-type domain-containing protein n=1 Tax=Nonomuraea recticatena TaxID=46178 RepID=A0ABP6F749_9ACTN
MHDPSTSALPGMPQPDPLPASEWSGWRVAAVSASGRRRLAGVLLPPAKAGGMPRLHSDHGGVVPLDPARWLIEPEVGLEERRKSRRLIHCPAGRLIYRYGDLPVAQLATMTMLRRTRRRPADGQQPIASYMIYRGYAPLYSVADSVELPPLPPSRQAARDLTRTCARCGAKSDRPWEKGRDGQRYCGDCFEPAAEAWWRQQCAVGREAAQAWARDVLADPATLLVYAPGEYPRVRLRAETLDGQVVVDVHLWRGFNEQRAADRLKWWPEQERDRYTDPADAVDLVRRLDGHRLVAAYAPLGVRHVMNGVDDFDPHVAEGDQFRNRWDAWKAEHPGGLFRHSTRVKHQQLPYDPDELIGFMRAGLVEMAESAADPGDAAGGHR